LKHSQLDALERLYRRRLSPEEPVSLDLSRTLIDLSREIGRQVALLISRLGTVEYVIVGDDKSIFIPDLKQFPLGKKTLRGLRLIHTHLKREPINTDDLTDLSLLRLDLLIAIDASTPSSMPVFLQTAHLIPALPNKPPYKVNSSQQLSGSEEPFSRFINSLESSLQSQRVTASSVDRDNEQAILVSVTKQSIEEAQDSMDELKELSRTAGINVLDTVIQRPRQFTAKYLMGEGKLREIIINALQSGATMLVFDQELTPTQVRTISSLTELKVIDRSQLILDIFARRAITLDGKVQVELAQLKYLLPRLTGRGVQMSRLMGGIGGRGPGETKLELDRRRIRSRISKLEKELAKLSDNRYQRRQKRVKASVPIISIIGYTNAGKSTLLNSLTQSHVFTENLLFATLDTSTRRLRFPQDREVIITDTVGFIRSLPTSLLGAFRATLEELNDANLLIHLVDCTNPRFIEQINAVNNILTELGLNSKEQILVFNKSDQLAELKIKNPLLFMKIRKYMHDMKSIMIAASDRKTLQPLLDELSRRFWQD
jgi:GTP-binding protein HflX